MRTNPDTARTGIPPHRPVPKLPPALFAGATVLSVWAHPDDETYLGGGLMAAATGGGGRVVNVTATLGEHGTPDPVALPPSRLAPIRRRELTAALAALGVHESVVLGYEDGTLDAVDVEEGVAHIDSVLTAVEPDLVVTFGPDGITGHPDHIAVGRWTEEAVAACPRPPALLQAANPADTPGDLTDALRELGAYFPGYPVLGVTGCEFALALDDSAVDTKLAALAAHATQTDVVRAALGEATYRRMASIEAFRPVNEAAADLLTGALVAAA